MHNKGTSRTQRVAEQLQRELALLIQHELKDPRVGWVSITGVGITRDLAYAKVFFSVLGDDSAETLKATQAALTHAAGFLRSQAAQRVRMRSMPELIFVYDHSLAEGNRMSALIDQAIAEDTKKPKD